MSKNKKAELVQELRELVQVNDLELPTTHLLEPRDLVRYTNSFIDSLFDGTPVELKMLYCIINALNPDMEKFQKDLFGQIPDKIFRIPIQKVFGKKYGYTTLIDAAQRLVGRQIFFKYNDKNSDVLWRGYSPIPFAEVSKGYVSLRVLGEVLPYLVDLKLYNYTTLDFRILMELNTVYSSKLYSKVKSKMFMKSNEAIPLEELKLFLGVKEQKSYAKFSLFQQSVLAPACEEITKVSDIDLEYKVVKDGKKVVAIKFLPVPKKVAAKALVEEKQLEFVQQDVRDQIDDVEKVLNEMYTFTSEQKKKILTTEHLRIEFVKRHMEIQTGVLKVKNTRTQLVAFFLGFKGKKLAK